MDLRTATIRSLEDTDGIIPATADAPAPRRGSARSGTLRRSTRTLIALLAALAGAEGVVIVWQASRAGVSAGRTLPEPAGRSGEEPRAAAATRRADVPLPAPSPQPERPVPAFTPQPPGGLRVATDGPVAAVFVDGRRRGVTPLTVTSLAPGSHRVRLAVGTTSVEDTVTVEPGRTSMLLVPFSLARPQAGWVEVGLPFDVQVLEEGRIVGTSAQARLQFAAGEHRLVLVNHSLGYQALERVLVKSGEVTRLRPDVPSGSLHINALPWAEVLIDGRPVGTTPLANVRAPLGPHELRFRHPDFDEQVRHVLVTAGEPARVGVELGR